MPLFLLLGGQLVGKLSCCYWAAVFEFTFLDILVQDNCVDAVGFHRHISGPLVASTTSEAPFTWWGETYFSIQGHHTDGHNEGPLLDASYQRDPRRFESA